MGEQKNFIVALILSFGIFIGWDHFFGTKPSVQQAPQVQQTSQTGQPQEVPQAVAKETPIVSRQDAVKDKRVNIKTDLMSGSISLKGGNLDDISLLKYKTSVENDAVPVDLLNPKNVANAYFVDFEVLCATNLERPDQNTVWELTSENKILEPGKPITLTWKNTQNLQFERTFSVDDDYLIKVTNKVVNHSSAPVCMQQKAYVHRSKPKTEGFFILHEGAIGFIDNHLQERDYDKLADNPKEDISSKGGWVGFTDKYWLVALLPHSDASATFSFMKNDGTYSTSAAIDQKSIEPGEALEQSIHIFAGPKKLALLDGIEAKLNIKKFDLAIDFGWFYFLTKPLFQFLDLLYSFVGNFGIAILIFTLISKLVLFPLANKSYYSMGRMKALGPKLEELKKRYKDDPVKLQKEMMNLYKVEKVNPLSGCLPMLIQAPIFFCLYKVLFVSIEMRHAPFFGWIHDLSAPDPSTIFNLFGLIPFTPPSFLMIGIWPILMGATMLWQQRLNPQPMDDAQAKMMMLMPVVFTFILSSFPAGLVIYWTFGNVLSIIQQSVIMKMAKKTS